MPLSLERSWILYDIGNSAFTLLVSTLVPIYFNSLASSANVNEDLAVGSLIVLIIIGFFLFRKADKRNTK